MRPPESNLAWKRYMKINRSKLHKAGPRGEYHRGLQNLDSSNLFYANYRWQLDVEAARVEGGEPTITHGYFLLAQFIHVRGARKRLPSLIPQSSFS